MKARINQIWKRQNLLEVMLLAGGLVAVVYLINAISSIAFLRY